MRAEGGASARVNGKLVLTHPCGLSIIVDDDAPGRMVLIALHRKCWSRAEARTEVCIEEIVASAAPPSAITSWRGDGWIIPCSRRASPSPVAKRGLG